MQISDIIHEIELIAPPPLQDGYDNSGIQVGNKADECTGVLLCVDVTPDIVEEAVNRRCNLIVSHHPLIFRGLKRLTGSTPAERSAIKAIENKIVIYSCHTNLDNAPDGVSHEMARRLGLSKVSILQPQEGRMMKLITMVPHSHVETVRSSLFTAGAGTLGNYDSCSYGVMGEGTFRAIDGANPYVGSLHSIHTEPETRLEILLPSWLQSKIERVLLDAHPYEEPAYDFINLANNCRHAGSGVIGTLTTPVSAEELIQRVKSAFDADMVRCTSLPQSPLSRIAMCGGSGAFLIKNAIAAGAQAYITSDVKYHDFAEYCNDIFIIDIGHYESEQCTKDIFYHVISKKFSNFAVCYSEKEKNPINYK